MNLKAKTSSNNKHDESESQTDKNDINKRVTDNVEDQKDNKEQGSTSKCNIEKNEKANQVQEVDKSNSSNNKKKSFVIPTQIPIMTKSNLKPNKMINKNENINLNISKDDSENIIKNTKEPAYGFVEMKIKDSSNAVGITPKPLIQSDEDSDEVDEYESSDNEENSDEEENKDIHHYSDPVSYTFMTSNIESEHEMDLETKSESKNIKEKNPDDKTEQLFNFKKTMNELVLAHEKKILEKGKNNIDAENQNEVIDNDNSVVFTNLNDIEDDDYKNENENENENISSNTGTLYKIKDNNNLEVDLDNNKSNENKELDDESDVDIDTQDEDQINNELLKYLLNNNDALLNLYNSSKIKNLDTNDDDDNDDDNNDDDNNNNNNDDDDKYTDEEEQEEEEDNDDEKEFNILKYIYNLEKKQNSLVELKKKLKRLQEAQETLVKQQEVYKNELKSRSLNENDGINDNNKDEEDLVNIEAENNENNLTKKEGEENKEKEKTENNDIDTLNSIIKKDDYSNEDLDRLNNLLHEILVEETNNTPETLLNKDNTLVSDNISNDIFSKLIEINKKQEELKKLREYMDYLKEYASLFNQSYTDNNGNDENDENDEYNENDDHIEDIDDHNNNEERHSVENENVNANVKSNKTKLTENKENQVSNNDEKDLSEENELEDIYSTYEVLKTNDTKKLNIDNEDTDIINNSTNKYSLSFLDDLDQESQSLFEKLEELEQRQNSLQKLLKSQSLTIDKEEKGIDEFIKNESLAKKENDMVNIDSHVQEAIEAMRRISESDDLSSYNDNNSQEKRIEKSNINENNLLVPSQYDNNLNNLLNNKLNEKIYNEVSNLITKNEKYPYFLLQLFRSCNKIENETQWQKLLILIENLIDEDFDLSNDDTGESDQIHNNTNDLSSNIPKSLPITDITQNKIKEDNVTSNVNKSLKHKKSGISDDIFKQLYTELDKVINDKNDKTNKQNDGMNNSKDDTNNIHEDKKINNINDSKKEYNELSTIDGELDELEKTADLDGLDDRQACMALLEKKRRYENELKKLLQLQKEQIQYKEKIEKQLEEQRKILELKKFYEQKRQEHDEQLNLTKKIVNQDKEGQINGSKKLSATEEAKKFLADNNDSLNYIFDELIKSKNILAGDENEGISPNHPVW